MGVGGPGIPFLVAAHANTAAAGPARAGGGRGPAPAIANAICDASGARVRELPITPERLYRALARKEDGEG